MTGRVGSAWQRILAVALLVAMVAGGTAVYLRVERPKGDRKLARLAVLDLSISGDVLESAEATRSAFTAVLDDRQAFVDLYLHSASAKRLPDVTVHADRAWRCYLIADQVWRLYEAGEVRPRVADVYGADALLAEVPELAAARSGSGADATLDNTRLSFARALFAAAAAEQAQAADALAAGE